MNLYGFVGNDGITRLDKLGLTMIRKPTQYLNRQDIFDTEDGAGARTKYSPYPWSTGDTDYATKTKGNQCCAKIKSAELIKFRVTTILPSDWGQPIRQSDGLYDALTHEGYRNVVAHEMRRLQSLKDADEAFLRPAEGRGKKVTRCGWVCRDTMEAAKFALYIYELQVQEAAKDQFTEWVEEQQDLIKAENDHWVTTTTSARFLESGKMVTNDVILFWRPEQIHKWVKPVDKINIDCPPP